MSQISFNPSTTTTASGLFNTNSTGFTQGDAMDDPAVKFWLCQGIVSADQSTPIWGGIPIQELIPAAAASPGTSQLGSTILSATDLANSTGICVFNQAYAGIITPQTAPQYTSGGSVNYYRFGSGARIPLPINAGLVSLDGGLITQPVTWDYTTNEIITYDSTNAFPVRILQILTTGNKCISYNSGTGVTTWTNTGALALCLI
jgi:hypothetical protein